MNNNIKIYTLMTLSALFWSGAFIAGKFGVGEFSPVALTFFRFFFASIIIFIIMVKYEKKDWRLKREDIGVFLITGIAGMVGYHILFFTALKYTAASSASILAATNPIITAILASIFIGEKLDFKRVLVILLALFGVILTISNWNIKVIMNLSFNKGDIIMLMAVFAWAAYSVIVKKVMPKFTPLILTTYSFIVCTIVLLPFVIREIFMGSISNISSSGWISVLYMSIFPTVIGYLIQQMSIKEIGASKTAIFINLVPFFSIILGVLILGEKINPLRLFSGMIIIFSVYLNSRISIKNKASA